MEPLDIALLGCGTVGSGVARLLLEQPERLAARAGRPLVLRRVVVRDLDKPRAVRLPRELLTTDLQQVLRDPAIQVVAELVGGVDWARQAVLALLAAGKDVVTANKALLALHGGGGLRRRPAARPGHRLRGQRGRRRADHRRPGAEPGRQPDHWPSRASSTAPATSS